MKLLFSLLAGGVFAMLTILLVGIYCLFGLLARAASLLAMPFHRLFSGH